MRNTTILLAVVLVISWRTLFVTNNFPDLTSLPTTYRLLFPVTTNSLPSVLTSLSADFAALSPSSLSELQPLAPQNLTSFQTCHDGRQINTCMLKSTEKGLCGWLSTGDSAEGGKYEVCVLTGGETTKACVMRGSDDCRHSTSIFPPAGQFAALSCSYCPQ